MAIYDGDGKLISAGDDQESASSHTPFLSSAKGKLIRYETDFDVNDFDILHTFTPFADDYSAESGIYNYAKQTTTQQQFYDLFYNPYIGYHGDLLVTKKNLGKDQSGLYNIWCYDIIPRNAKKKICISSGMHPYETPASFGLARWIKEYMESNDGVFAYLRNNLQLSIIPIVNPWGFNQYPKTYPNVNGVNPNRNFDNWTGAWESYPVYTPEENIWNVKGDAPFSEAETKVLCNWIKDNTDAEFYIDCHTGALNQAGAIWYYVNSTNANLLKIRNAANILIGRLQSVYGGNPTIQEELNHSDSIKTQFFDEVVGMPTLVLEQATYTDTVYQTEPNNCKTAICEYATNIHAFVMAQLKDSVST